MSSVLPWKEEPLSPPYFEEATPFDATFYQTSFDDVKTEEENGDKPRSAESKAEFASQILEDLENLVDLDELIKEEPFLLDEKMLPAFEEVEPPRAVPVALHHLKSELEPRTDTQTLIKEFETVYDVVEFTHEALTPPQSPPQSDAPVLTTLKPISTRDGRFESDLALELAEVDELVRTRVEDLQGFPGSPEATSSSCFGDCASSDDPEWVPEAAEEFGGGAKRRKVAKREKKAPEEKKVRKKEQNKNAATRYRMKKKAEVEVIQSEEKDLADYNGSLKGRIGDLEKEVGYLKGLMREMFRAKGIIQ